MNLYKFFFPNRWAANRAKKVNKLIDEIIERNVGMVSSGARYTKRESQQGRDMFLMELKQQCESLPGRMKSMLGEDIFNRLNQL
jgi:DNA polymerase III delta prime subunit